MAGFPGGKRRLLVGIAGLERPLLVGITILGGAQDNASPLEGYGARHVQHQSTLDGLDGVVPVRRG